MEKATINSWRAKRAGGRITVYGKDNSGAEIKVPNVDEITADSSGPIATDKNGDRYRLAL